MIEHSHIADHALRALIRQKRVVLAGHRKSRIYGLLSCRSGKRMRREARVFFASDSEAQTLGFRPCGHCMKMEYERWLTRKA